MDDNVLRLEFGEGALKDEERGALFRVADWMGESLFGEVDVSSTFKESIEFINVSGEYAKVSRLIIRNLGCVVGKVVNVEYFKPTYETYIEGLIEIDDESECEDDDSYIGRHISLVFDNTDGSFYRYDSLSRLYIDDEGESEIIAVGSYYENHGERNEAFDDLIEDEITTPTVDDYFIVNTVRMMAEKKLLS